LHARTQQLAREQLSGETCDIDKAASKHEQQEQNQITAEIKHRAPHAKVEACSEQCKDKARVKRLDDPSRNP
jgi:hypothetical protein